MNYQKHAKIIVNTNMKLKNKDSVLITTGPDALEFAEAIAVECSRIGAMPTIQYASDKMALKQFNVMKDKHLKNWPKLWDTTSKIIDAEIILDDSNPLVAKDLPQKKIEIRRKLLKPIKDRTEKRTWKKDLKVALVGFPTKEKAKMMGIPYPKLNKIFWDTMSVNYQKLYKDIEKLSKKMKKANKIRIVGEKTDLELSIKGRDHHIDAGMVEKEIFYYLNIPSGELFFAPIENSANGEIYFDLPCLYHYGKKVKGVWFKFKNGKVVKYKIDQGKKNFEDVLKNASGTKWQIAELGLGMNPRAKVTGGMTIVDEKVKGTIHIAIGSNKHFGGKGDSTIHWDFYKNMKKGKLYVDGKLLMDKGKWLI